MARKPVEINPECGRRLKQIIVEKGVKQGALAKKIHNHPQHISNIINGRRSLTLEVAQNVVKVFPEIRVKWLLCEDDFKTESDKQAYSKKVYEDGLKASASCDEAFKRFIVRLEDLRGYGLEMEEDSLIGEYIAVTNATGGRIGAIPPDAYRNLKREVENYATYLIRQIINSEMCPVPGDGKEGIEEWLTFKNAVISREN